jgi:hypothetical protein
LGGLWDVAFVAGFDPEIIFAAANRSTADTFILMAMNTAKQARKSNFFLDISCWQMDAAEPGRASLASPKAAS